MKWNEEYNEFRHSHDWKQYKTRDQIDEVIVKKLCELLDKQEALIEQLQNTSSNSGYAKCLEELKAQVKWNGWEDPYITNILRKHFA